MGRRLRPARGPALGDTGLKAWSPTRYGALDVTVGNTITDDSLSYDIFSQAVKAVRSPAGLDPLGTLAAPDYVIATGHSQSAGRLRTYANSIQPLANIVDAVVLHGGGGAMRTDTPTPVFRINSEGDISRRHRQRRARSGLADVPQLGGRRRLARRLEADHGLRPAAQARHRHLPRRLSRRAADLHAAVALANPAAHGPERALRPHASTGSRTASRRRRRPVITTATPAGGAITRDSLGLAQGGIRLAQQDVPLRVNTGTNTGPASASSTAARCRCSDAQLADALPDGAVLRRQGRRADARQRREGLHPGRLHPRSGVVHRHPRPGQRLRHADPERRGRPAAGQRSRRPRSTARRATTTRRSSSSRTSPPSPAAGSPGDAAARDAVLRPTKAIIALLRGDARPARPRRARPGPSAAPCPPRCR